MSDRPKQQSPSVNKREYWYPRTRIPNVKVTEPCRLEVDVTRGVIVVSHGGNIKLRITSVPAAAYKREMIDLYLPQRSFLKEK